MSLWQPTALTQSLQQHLQQSWVMSMQWHDLLFVHYPVPGNLLRPYIPAGLSIDTIHGNAYVAVVPFVMRHVRPRNMPSMPWVSFFPEINLRTYVTALDQDRKPGVWFFSLDAHNPLAVRLARTLFHLPYFDATMHAKVAMRTATNISTDLATGTSTDTDIATDTDKENTPEVRWIDYQSVRQQRGNKVGFAGKYRPLGEPFYAQAGSLEHFLVERYCFYSSDPDGRIYRGDIQHQPWALQTAELELSHNSLHEPWDIPLSGEPLLHYGRYLNVRAFLPRLIRDVPE